MTIKEAEPLFDTFVIVDWSAANQKKTGRDSIWICHKGPRGPERIENPETRHFAKVLLGDLLADALARGGSALVGFDFPFGYPVGFANRLGLIGLPWRAIWEEIDRLLEDNEKNENNRFDLASIFNRRISGSIFPFWGCPPKKSGSFLGPKHHQRDEPGGLRERRLIDEYMVGAQPCWKLLGAGSVGGQVLTGIPVVHALRNDNRLSEHARIWPFETGLRAPTDARIVFAEVWPSFFREWKTTKEPNEVNDRAQVRHVASFFAERAKAGELAALFAGDPSLSPEDRSRVETEEAWTLGVTARRKRPEKTPSPPTRRRERVGVRGVAGQSKSVADPHPPIAGAMDPPLSRDAGEGKTARVYTYLRDPAAIYRRSFALIRAEADLTRFPPGLRPLAIRLVHAAGDVAILDDLAWSRGAVAAGRRALAAGAAVIVDSTMAASGIARDRLPAANPVICTLRDPAVAGLAAAQATTRSAAAVELWRPHLAGSVVAIGNAPTALFRLIEILAGGADRPALVLGFPVGFVGAAEAKEALIGFGRGLAYVTLKGRRGGSALAAAAVNALSGDMAP
jgi:precorrin-8X/cobalt-precorrin-8 methylmutase